jgi:hypothetical protein
MNYINITNSTTLKPKKGTKILKLKACTAENSLKIYKTNSYLINVYMFYSNKGYKSYKSISSFITDFQSNAEDCMVRTFLTVFNALIGCSNFPFLKSRDRYTYSCLSEQDLVEQKIEETFYQVFIELKGNFDRTELKNLSKLRTHIKMQIKYKAHLDRIIKKNKNIVPVQTEFLQNTPYTNDPESQYIKKERIQLINDIFYNYINTKDTIDRLIIKTNIIRRDLPNGLTKNNKFTLSHIAILCNVSENTLVSRKKKLITELDKIYQTDVKPLILE